MKARAKRWEDIGKLFTAKDVAEADAERGRITCCPC